MCSPTTRLKKMLCKKTYFMRYYCPPCASPAPFGVLRVIRPDAGEGRRAFFDGGGACDSPVLPKYRIPGNTPPSQPGCHSGGDLAPGASALSVTEQEHFFDLNFGTIFSPNSLPVFPLRSGNENVTIQKKCLVPEPCLALTQPLRSAHHRSHQRT